ncbi:unnamed protein product [Chrysoparadoxa australica]
MGARGVRIKSYHQPLFFVAFCLPIIATWVALDYLLAPADVLLQGRMLMGDGPTISFATVTHATVCLRRAVVDADQMSSALTTALEVEPDQLAPAGGGEVTMLDTTEQCTQFVPDFPQDGTGTEWKVRVFNPAPPDESDPSAASVAGQQIGAMTDSSGSFVLDLTSGIVAAGGTVAEADVSAQAIGFAVAFPQDGAIPLVVDPSSTSGTSSRDFSSVFATPQYWPLWAWIVLAILILLLCCCCSYLWYTRPSRASALAAKHAGVIEAEGRDVQSLVEEGRAPGDVVIPSATASPFDDEGSCFQSREEDSLESVALDGSPNKSRDETELSAGVIELQRAAEAAAVAVSSPPYSPRSAMQDPAVAESLSSSLDNGSDYDEPSNASNASGVAADAAAGAAGAAVEAEGAVAGVAAGTAMGVMALMAARQSFDEEERPSDEEASGGGDEAEGLSNSAKRGVVKKVSFAGVETIEQQPLPSPYNQDSVWSGDGSLQYSEPNYFLDTDTSNFSMESDVKFVGEDADTVGSSESVVRVPLGDDSSMMSSDSVVRVPLGDDSSMMSSESVVRVPLGDDSSMMSSESVVRVPIAEESMESTGSVVRLGDEEMSVESSGSVIRLADEEGSVGSNQTGRSSVASVADEPDVTELQVVHSPKAVITTTAVAAAAAGLSVSTVIDDKADVTQVLHSPVHTHTLSPSGSISVASAITDEPDITEMEVTRSPRQSIPADGASSSRASRATVAATGLASTMPPPRPRKRSGSPARNRTLGEAFEDICHPERRASRLLALAEAERERSNSALAPAQPAVESELQAKLRIRREKSERLEIDAADSTSVVSSSAASTGASAAASAASMAASATSATASAVGTGVSGFAAIAAAAGALGAAVGGAVGALSGRRASQEPKSLEPVQQSSEARAESKEEGEETGPQNAQQEEDDGDSLNAPSLERHMSEMSDISAAGSSASNGSSLKFMPTGPIPGIAHVPKPHTPTRTLAAAPTTLAGLLAQAEDQGLSLEELGDAMESSDNGAGAVGAGKHHRRFSSGSSGKASSSPFPPNVSIADALAALEKEAKARGLPSGGSLPPEAVTEVLDAMTAMVELDFPPHQHPRHSDASGNGRRGSNGSNQSQRRGSNGSSGRAKYTPPDESEPPPTTIAALLAQAEDQGLSLEDLENSL